MRNLVQPLPSTHCEHCDGELLFKCIERDDVQIFVFVQNAVAESTHVS